MFCELLDLEFGANFGGAPVAHVIIFMYGCTIHAAGPPSLVWCPHTPIVLVTSGTMQYSISIHKVVLLVLIVVLRIVEFCSSQGCAGFRRLIVFCNSGSGFEIQWIFAQKSSGEMLFGKPSGVKVF